MHDETTIQFSRNLMTIPVRFVRISGPDRRVLLRETPLKILDALSTQRTSTGLLTLSGDTKTIPLSRCLGDRPLR